MVSHQEIYESSQWRMVERKEVRKNWSTRIGRIARHYDNVAAPALLDDRLLHQEIGGFSFGQAQPVDGRPITPWIRVPDRDIEDAWRDALSGFRERAGDVCKAASGSDHVEQFKWTPEFRNRHDTLMLLPVYASFYLDDAEIVLISYGSAARSALHVVKNRRKRGERLGLLELQTLWPFPREIVKEKCANANAIVVVELNMGQVLQEVKLSVENSEKVFLANRIDGVFITPTDIMAILRLIQGKGV